MPTVTGKLSQQRPLRDRLASLSLIAILLFTAGLYALLMLQDEPFLFALVLLALVWVLHLWADRWAIYPTPLDVPILALLILMPLNLIISADPPLTLVRIDHLLLSFSLFFAIVRLVQLRKHFPALIFSLLILSIGAGLLGLLATDWQSSILLSFLSPIYETLPRLTAFVPGASINKNTMGGALAFFPPLLLSLLWDHSAFRKLISKYSGIKFFPIWFYKLLAFFALGLVLAVVFLTQSRGAWLGVAVGLYVLLVWRDKRFLWAIPIGVLALILFLNQTGIGGLSELFALLDQGQDASLQSRLDIWARIISLIRGFPVTGVGLDALNPVYQTFFNPFLFNEPPARLYHAHNSLLSVASEMGIPALILYVALLSGFGAMAWRAWKRARTINRVLIMGLVCGMIAHQVFGLMDAYPLGKNLGITMWIYFAVMTALYVHRSRMVRSHPQPQVQKAAQTASALLQGALISLAAWLILSLLSLAMLRVNVYASLLAAVVAGIFLGVMLVVHPLLSDGIRQPQPISYAVPESNDLDQS
ncbi:MAG TPA: O-antigen ligase family protein [Brevefilum sp.]|nr:O-antigen ligase family protein [Brevefilum sp.]HPL69850.1 O-antigen ligase family protein [Brevefilum sp.]